MTIKGIPLQSKKTKDKCNTILPDQQPGNNQTHILKNFEPYYSTIAPKPFVRR